MDLIISYNWLGEYLSKIPDTERLRSLLCLHGPTVERVDKIVYPWKGIVAGKIEEITEHPNAQKLSIAHVSIGESRQLKIVCGASNIKVGQIVPVALPGRARIKGELLKRRNIRGFISEAMLASPHELDLSGDHSGIWILSDNIKIGTALEKLLPSHDYLLKIEVTSNRHDLMSVAGIAREVCAITGTKFLDPFQNKIKTYPGGGLKVEVKSKDCVFYQLSLLDEAELKPSPLIWQIRLFGAGLRPINNIVDATNYVMLEYGHPSHAFSFDSSKGRIVVRKAKGEEKLLALDGKEYALNEADLVITNGNDVLGLAGVMGGELSSVRGSGKILLETAVFNPLSVRKTERAHNLSSRAAQLFEKGIPPFLAAYSSQRVAQLLGVSVLAQAAVKNYFFPRAKIKFSSGFAREKIGVEISRKDQVNFLKALGFKAKVYKEKVDIEVPWWREGDVAMDVDIVEEIARLYGYENIPQEIPAADFSGSASDRFFHIESLAKRNLAFLGYKEIITPPFLSEKEVQLFSLPEKDLVEISNPLTEDARYLRPNLLSTALPVVSRNGDLLEEFGAFELSRIYGAQKKGLPQERYELLVLEVGRNLESAFQKIKGACFAILESFGLGRENLKEGVDKISIFSDKDTVGEIGIVPQNLCFSLGLKSFIAYFSLDFERLWPRYRQKLEFLESEEFPAVKRDISFVLTKKIRYNEIEGILSGIDPLLKKFELFDRYKFFEEGSEEKISWAFHLYFSSSLKTLREEEIKIAEDKIIKALENKLGAYVRSKAH